jgi:hypothetical protein
MLSADPGPPASAATLPSLTSLLAMTENTDRSDVEYVIGGQQLADTEREMAAQLLADDAMRTRCGKSPVLARWRARRDGGPPATGAPAAAVKVYAGIGFGLPGASANDDHLQGAVAELLWNRLIQERLVCRDKRRLVQIPPPSAADASLWSAAYPLALPVPARIRRRITQLALAPRWPAWPRGRRAARAAGPAPPAGHGRSRPPDYVAAAAAGFAERCTRDPVGGTPQVYDRVRDRPGLRTAGPFRDPVPGPAGPDPARRICVAGFAPGNVRSISLRYASRGSHQLDGQRAGHAAG